MHKIGEKQNWEVKNCFHLHNRMRTYIVHEKLLKINGYRELNDIRELKLTILSSFFGKILEIYIKNQY